MKNKTFKNFSFNMIGSTVNSVTSLFLLIFVIRINGVDIGGIFSFSFSTACLLQVIANYAGRAYQVTERSADISDNDFIYNKIVCCFIMILAGFIFIFIKNYSYVKCLILMLLTLFKMIESFAEVIYAIVQKNDDLYKVGISLFLKGLLGIVIFLLVDLFTKNVMLSILSLILLNIIIIVFYDIINLKKYNLKMKKMKLNNVLKIFKFGFFTFTLTLMTQYVINASKYSIDNYLSDKYQTVFGIIVMPATVIILCGQFIIHPFLNKLTNFLKNKQINEFNKMIFKLSLTILMFGICSCVIAYFIGIPFLQLLYKIKLGKYLIDLVLIVFGSTCFGVAYIISNALITLRDTFSQVIIFIVTSLFAFFISNYLVLKFGIHGASYSYLYTMIFLMVVYIGYYIVKQIFYCRKKYL